MTAVMRLRDTTKPEIHTVNRKLVEPCVAGNGWTQQSHVADNKACIEWQPRGQVKRWSRPRLRAHQMFRSNPKTVGEAINPLLPHTSHWSSSPDTTVNPLAHVSLCSHTYVPLVMSHTDLVRPSTTSGCRVGEGGGGAIDTQLQPAHVRASNRMGRRNSAGRHSGTEAHPFSYPGAVLSSPRGP